jgi:hypothetical protein
MITNFFHVLSLIFIIFLFSFNHFIVFLINFAFPSIEYVIVVSITFLFFFVIKLFVVLKDFFIFVLKIIIV